MTYLNVILNYFNFIRSETMDRREFMALLAAAPLSGCASVPGRTKAPTPLVGYVRTNWSQDPFSYGSYSYFANGSGDADRKTLLEPIGDRVYFAGEALNPNYQVSVHAAFESGQSVAKQLAAAQNRNIAIIGAGISGISAAKHLSEQGKNVVIFEGRDRIGGRIYTDRNSLGTPLDLGASWIHGPDGNPISALSDQVGINRIPTPDEYVIRGKNGREIWSLLAPSWVWEWAEYTSTGAEVGKLNLKATTDQFSEYGFGYKGTDVVFPNGYDEIFTGLQGDYEVRLNSTVDRIQHSSSEVKVGVIDEGVEKYDAVIVTVPLGVLKKKVIAFSPALPEQKQAAIARMGMGTLDKLYLRFEEPFWDDKSNIITPGNGLPQGQFNFWFNISKYVNQPIIMAFNAGTAALQLSQEPDNAVVDRALKTLAGVYG